MVTLPVTAAKMLQMLLFLGLHNSSLGLSWLLGRGYMPVFRALKRLMHKLRRVQPVRMSGTVECDEVNFPNDRLASA